MYNSDFKMSSFLKPIDSNNQVLFQNFVIAFFLYLSFNLPYFYFRSNMKQQTTDSPDSPPHIESTSLYYPPIKIIPVEPVRNSSSKHRYFFFLI